LEWLVVGAVPSRQRRKRAQTMRSWSKTRHGSRKERKRKTAAEREVEDLRDLLWHLTYAAERVSDKYGVHEDDTPSDWQEWVDLRVAIADAKTKGKIR
jgi:hypothetical protein